MEIIVPLASIVVPNYNHEPFLKQRLNSIFNQTFQDFEVIILDDCSTDASVQLLQTYVNHPKVSHFIINKKNTGSPFKQWQKGIELAKGTYIWIAESDDYCELNFLEEMVQLLKENKNVGVAYCQTLDINEIGKLLLQRIKYTQEFVPNIWEGNFEMDGFHFVKKYLCTKNVIPNASAVVFKKELVTNSIFSNELVEMRMCGDWFFWIQLLLKSNVAFLSKPLNYFRNHSKVSRQHTTIAIQKKRLTEEAQIRNYMQTKNIYNSKSVKKLYAKWFKLHRFSSIFTSSFYKVKQVKLFRFNFVWYFLKPKLVKKLHGIAKK